MENPAIRHLLDERNARLVAAPSRPLSTEYILRRYFEVRDDKLLEDCYSFLLTYTSTSNSTPSRYVTAPLADNELYEGRWYQVQVEVIRDQEHYGIIQTLHRVFSPSSFEELSGIPYLRRTEKEVLGVFGLAEGQGDAYTVHVLNLEPTDSNQQWFMMLPDSDLERLYAETGYRLVGRIWDSLAESGIATFIAVFRRVAWERGWEDRQLLSIRDPSGYGYAETHIAMGLSKEKALSEFESATNPDDGFVVERSALSQRALGEYLLERTQARVYDGTTVADAIIVSARRAIGRGQASITRIWPRRTSAARDQLVAEGGAAVSDWGTYTHHEYTIQDHGDGAWTVVQHLVDLADAGVTWPNIDKYEWLEYGVVGVSYRSAPTDGSEGTMQISYHIRRTERLFTNDLVKAYMFANLNYNDGDITWEGGFIDHSTVENLQNMGQTGKYKLVWGKLIYKENRRPTRYEAWRCVMDYWTNRDGTDAWEPAVPIPPGNWGLSKSVRTSLPRTP